jgi:hypothetical protein
MRPLKDLISPNSGTKARREPRREQQECRFGRREDIWTVEQFTSSRGALEEAHMRGVPTTVRYHKGIPSVIGSGRVARRLASRGGTYKEKGSEPLDRETDTRQSSDLWKLDEV